MPPRRLRPPPRHLVRARDTAADGALGCSGHGAAMGLSPRPGKSARHVWLFDLDDTLHDAAGASMPGITEGMTAYIVEHLGLTRGEADLLRRLYWQRYGATLLGLMRHHGVDPRHFLHAVHTLPGLEARVRARRHDLDALRRLPGRKVLLTNAPAAYAARVLAVLGIAKRFERVLAIEDMRMFGHWRPKPDTRMLRGVAVRLGVAAARCVLIEDTPHHLKAARRVGMGTVWMQRWRRPPTGRRHARGHADRRVQRLQQLVRMR